MEEQERKEVSFVEDVPRITRDIKPLLRDFFREYANIDLITGDTPKITQHNTTYRTPIITNEIDGRIYQAESCFQDYGPMGSNFDGSIIVVNDLEKANEFAREFVKKNEENLRAYNPNFQGRKSVAIYDKSRPTGNWGSLYVPVENPEHIKLFFDKEKGLIDLLEVPFLCGRDNYKVIRGSFIGYEGNSADRWNIEDLLEEI